MSLAGTAVSEDWAAPRGPDDDAGFLSELDRLIRGTGESGAED